MNQIERSLIAAGTGLAIAMSASACSQSEQVSPEVACSEDNTRPMPTEANLKSVVDDRHGEIYPCMYMNDEGFPYNEPTNLGTISIETRDQSSFKSEASLGGFAIFGSGFIGGNEIAQGKTERVRAAILSFEDNEGYYQTVTVDAEKVRKKFCVDECQPTVEFVVPNNVMWTKGANDDTSIWSNLASGRKIGTDAKDERTAAVKGLALQTDFDESYPEYFGGPERPGKVISSLASQINLTLPASARPDSTSAQ